MTWSRQQYEDRIRDRLGDLGLLQHIPETSIPLALEKALSTFGKDKPRTAVHLLSGDGTKQEWDLLAGADPAPDWQETWSRILSIEHPTGEIPREYLERGIDWTIEDGTLIFFSAPDTGTDNIRLRHTALWDFPDDAPGDDPNPIPEVYAQAIADLAAGNLIRGKAVEFARQQSQSVAGDLFQRDAGPLFQAADELKGEYEATVLGRPSGDEDGAPAKQVAMAVTDVSVFPNSLFHQRHDLAESESEIE